MSHPHVLLRNRAEHGQRQIEPVLVCVEHRMIDLLAPLKPVLFEPQRMRVITCTPPMVYGVGGPSPRIRMRRVDQLGGRRMQTDRYQPIG
jgi:hypothetical protein